MGVHPKIPIIIVTLQFIVLFVNNNYFAEAQNPTTHLPTCFIELLHFNTSSSSPLEVINTVDLTGSTGQHIICGAPSPTSSEFSHSLKCDQNVILINSRSIASARFTCHDVNPLQYNQEQPPPFGDVVVDFSKTFLGNGSFQHQISATFPELEYTNYGEELEAYSGVYTMSRESPEKWEIRIQLNITSTTENDVRVKERSSVGSSVHYCGTSKNERFIHVIPEICRKGSTCTDQLKADKSHCRVPNYEVTYQCFPAVVHDTGTNEFSFELLGSNTMLCKAGQTESGVYLVNIGGNNPTETGLRKSCLDASGKNDCRNTKYGETASCDRKCKRISRIHDNGLARCSYDGGTKDMEYFRDIIYLVIHTNMSRMWDHQLIIKIQRDDGENVLEIPEMDYIEHNFAVKYSNPGDYLTQYPIQEAETVFDQDETKFECHFSPYFLVAPVRWLVEWSNGSFEQHFMDNGENISTETKSVQGEISFPVKSSHVQISTRFGMVNVICEMMYWNSSVFARNVQPVNVQEGMMPEFESHEDFLTKNIDDPLELKCQVKEDVQPQPDTFAWKLQGQVLGETKPELKIPKLSTSDAGTYECTAFNFRGQVSKTFQVDVIDPTKTKWVIGVTTLAALVLILGLTLAGLYKAFLKRGTRLSQVEIKEFMNGNGKKGEENHSENINAQQMAYNKDYEIPWNQFKLDSQELGKGAHGVVFKGIIGELPIAVKTVREGVTKDVLKALLDELKIMIYLGNHERVVTLKGACTQFLEEGRAYVLVEFCPLGSMESFLRKNREFLRSQVLGGGYVNINAAQGDRSMSVENVTTRHFMKWSHQIAQGMKYLEEKKVIHADLAIRNILMSSIDHVKITDFGLSRQLINTNTYVKKTKALLPWKYMAPESLNLFNFTSKSDVWSYGVTIWEIFTVGSTPYPGMCWTTEFTQYLEDNMRMSRPKHAPEEMYKLMTKCWEFEPETRPSFAELEMILREMM